jgi:tetratricopeptide (TPR) repeat protein
MKLSLLTGTALTAGLLLVTGCPNQRRNDAKKENKEANIALGQKQFEEAVTHYEKAVDADRSYHPGWYGLGLARVGKVEWDKAVEAFEKCVELAPEEPMHQMWLGVSLYEKAVKQAREDQARKANKKPEEISPDLSAVSFEKSLAALKEAAKLNNDLWRAHYYLARIYRATDKPKEAAEEFTKAIEGNPREWAPYVALGELYRRWDYSDEAISVAQQGTANVPGQGEVSDIWYVLGMGYDDKRLDDKAIDAFSKALDAKRDNRKAEFQRGQAYFRKQDFVHAKRDLEEFSKSGGNSLEFAKSQANKMLMDMAAKAATPADKPAEKVVPGMPGKGGGKKHG